MGIRELYVVDDFEDGNASVSNERLLEGADKDIIHSGNELLFEVVDNGTVCLVDYVGLVKSAVDGCDLRARGVWRNDGLNPRIYWCNPFYDRNADVDDRG